jgi:hypothetical protein
MHANPLVRTALWVSTAALLLATPAQSQVVVQYTATITSGFGDGPAAQTTPTSADPAGPDTANNGFPACNATILGTLSSATQATAMFSGTAAVTTAGSAPRAVSFGTGTVGNGLVTTCLTTQTKIPPFLTQRVQMTTMTWPGSAGSFMAGGGFGGTPMSPFVQIPTFNSNQAAIVSTLPVTGMGPPTPSAKFGGALRVNGVSNAFLGVVNGPAVFTGTLPVKLSVGRAGTGGPTFQTTTTQTFMLKGQTAPTFPEVARQVFFPWTTGKVIVSDRTGNFWTFRTRSGFDNRNSAGTTGTLQLVTPALTEISGGLPVLPFAITSVLTLTFTPEPGATLLLAGGALTLLLLHVAWRRRL